MMKNLNFNKPTIMGILNVTPDSFYDGGRFHQKEHAIQQAQAMVADGADIIDIGGESTRPGAAEVSVQEECDRVLPIIDIIHQEFAIPISIDTSKPDVMSEAVNAGASLINDVRALQLPGALEQAAQCDVPVCLMHMQGQPRMMQENPHYDDLISDINAFFAERIEACSQAGIARDKIILDPGFGFGKTVEHNLQLIKYIESFLKFDLPILLGVSRKSTIGAVLDLPLEHRLHGSLALAVLAVSKGAKIIRTHDVAATVEALKIINAVESV